MQQHGRISSSSIKARGSVVYSTSPSISLVLHAPQKRTTKTFTAMVVNIDVSGFKGGKKRSIRGGRNTPHINNVDAECFISCAHYFLALLLSVFIV